MTGGEGAIMLTGAIVTGPVGMEALAGSWMDVVKPWTTTGMIAPGVPDTESCTRAADGMLFAIEVTSGTGPVTVKMEVAILMAGGVMVVVAPGFV